MCEQDRFPVHAAAQGGDATTLTALLAREPAISLDVLDGEDHWSCLHYAAFYNHVHNTLCLEHQTPRFPMSDFVVLFVVVADSNCNFAARASRIAPGD